MPEALSCTAQWQSEPQTRATARRYMLLPAAGRGRPGRAEDGRARRHAAAGVGHQPHAPAVQRAAPGAAAGRRVRGPHRGVVLRARLLLWRRPPHPVGLLRQPRLHLGGAPAPAPPCWLALSGAPQAACFGCRVRAVGHAARRCSECLRQTPPALPELWKTCWPLVGPGAIPVLTWTGNGKHGRAGRCSSCGSALPQSQGVSCLPNPHWRSSHCSAHC